MRASATSLRNRGIQLKYPAHSHMAGYKLSHVLLMRQNANLAGTPIVGRVHQINELVSVGREKLALDVGAINGPYWSYDFRSIHLHSPPMRLSYVYQSSPCPPDVPPSFIQTGNRVAEIYSLS